ncbi:MAG TPA: hypothetical protein VGC67_18410 [Cellulomonas sp.]
MPSWFLAAHRSPVGRRRPALSAAATAVLLGVSVAVAAPAWAAPAVTVLNSAGTALASTTTPTEVTVSGSGFQSVAGGFGGIYVMFGWVDDPASTTWAPSQGGVSGVDYRYAADTATTDNEGFQRFVAFPGSSTESSANGGVLAADGTWSLTMTIPTPQLDLIGEDGSTTSVDCQVVTCGILTIGAHGVANAANESFTPITFSDDLSASDPVAAPEPTASETTEAATVQADQSTAVLGGELAYTADGFAADEAVDVAIDGAVLAEATTDADGSVADAVALAEDLGVGEHELTLTGQDSGTTGATTFIATRDPAEVTAEEAAADGGGAPVGALVASGVVLLVLAAGVVVLVRHRSASRRTTDDPVPHTPEDGAGSSADRSDGPASGT